MIRRAMIAGVAAMLAACGGGEDASAPPSGARAFAECAICHTTAPPATPEGRIRLVGPNLFGVYGAPAAQGADFAYSKALLGAGLVWDDATLDAWIENPQKLVPNNRMAFAGQPDAARRAAVIEYLKTLK